VIDKEFLLGNNEEYKGIERRKETWDGIERRYQAIKELERQLEIFERHQRRAKIYASLMGALAASIISLIFHCLFN
jgi:predicted DNA-binding protein YlxM (UPF0122 family)